MEGWNRHLQNHPDNLYVQTDNNTQHHPLDTKWIHGTWPIDQLIVKRPKLRILNHLSQVEGDMC